jgi:hypothetical protein
MRSRPPALRGLAPPLTQSWGPIKIRSMRPPPRPRDQPTCSRWVSYSCCLSRRAKAGDEFFSANSVPNKSSTLVRPILEEEAALVEEAKPRKALHHLPLPPSLPYSPNSHPFKRQIEILSLYISGASPGQSWEIFNGIHVDIRRYIPDHIFRSLVIHQLASDDPHDRWSRSSRLLRFANKCGMEAKDLGQEVVEAAMHEGLRYALGDPKSRLAKPYPFIRQLWRSLTQLVNGELFRISTETRRSWLQLQLQRCVSGGFGSTRTAHTDEASSALWEIIEGGGGLGIEEVAARIITRDHTIDCQIQFEALRQIAACWSHGVELPFAYTMAAMRRLRWAWDRLGEDGLSKLSADVSTLVAELEPPSDTVDHLQRSVEVIRGHVPRTRKQKAFVLLESDEHRVPTLVREGMHVLGIQRRERLSTIVLGISLLERAVRQRDGESDALIARLLVKLSSAKVGPGTDSLIARLSNVLLNSDVLQHITPNLVHFLFHLILSTTFNDESYILARKVYPIARGVDPPFRWSHRNLHHWRELFHYSISPDRRHLHFASRLYADLLADDIPIRRTDAIAMIRAIGTSRGASRHILLERHVKDYLWMGYGSRRAFLAAIVQGLTASERGDDQLSAFNLIMRLSVDKPVPTSVASLLLGRLPVSPDGIDHRYFLDLLHSLPSDPDTAQSYDIAIRTLISRVRANPKFGHLTAVEGLARAIDLYKDMISREIPPTAQTVSLLIRGLSRAGYHDNAVKVCHASIDAKLVPSSKTVGRLMVRLGMVERYEEAKALRQRWGEIAPKELSREGVVGAQILLDLQRGHKVEMEKQARKGGWADTKSLLRYLETLKPPRAKSSVGLAQETPGTHAEPSTALAIRAVDQPGQADDTAADMERDAESMAKQRVRPQTWSLWNDEADDHDSRQRVGWLRDEYRSGPSSDAGDEEESGVHFMGSRVGIAGT